MDAAFIYDFHTDQWSWFTDAFYMRVRGLNNGGVFIGEAFTIETFAGGRKQRYGEPILFRHTDQLETLVSTGGITDNQMRWDAINSSGDMGLEDDTRGGPAIVHTGFAPDYSETTLWLVDLIPDDDPMKGTFIDSEPAMYSVNDRDDTGYGQTVCVIYVRQPDGSIQSRAVILTPFIPAP